MNSGLGEFLRVRRARVSPEDIGLPSAGLRRVPGLRREEVAELAGISADYYTRLEQDRSRVHPSAEVLDAVARILRLDAAEREHLHNLAGPRRRAPVVPHRPRPVPETTLRMLDLVEAPAMLFGPGMDVLAANAAATAVFDVAARTGNAAEYLFLDRSARGAHPNWDELAAGMVAQLRLASGRHPVDRSLLSLVDALSDRSADFRRLWAANDVRQKDTGRTLVAHPLVGELDFTYQVLAVSGTDQVLIVYGYPAGSPTDERLSLLHSWTRTPS